MNENEPVLTASELLAYRRANGSLPDFVPPHAVIFAPQKSLASYAYRTYSAKRIQGFIGEFYLLKRSKGMIGLSSGFGIGAPVVAGLTDEFAALGVKQFGLIGMAGGLQSDLKTGSLILSTGAVRGEGVSRHYLPADEVVSASMEMAQDVSMALKKQDQTHHLGLTWTTDAPFRELRRDVLAYQNRGILAVDMEAAGMLAVARSNNLSALAAFSVADTLADGVWNMSRDLKTAQQALHRLFDAMYACLLTSL